MPQRQVVDIASLDPVVRRVFPSAGSVSVEPASPGRLLAVYLVRADGAIYFLRVAGRLDSVFTAGELASLHSVVRSEQRRPASPAHLAHGDLDVTHIWLDDQGQYAGLIDFGEMRGADRYFDLGHFLLHDGETRPIPLFAHFLAGYAEVVAAAANHYDLIRRSAITSGLRQLSLWLDRERGDSPPGARTQRRATELRSLLDPSPRAVATVAL